jgi:hypothetical protein
VLNKFAATNIKITIAAKYLPKLKDFKTNNYEKKMVPFGDLFLSADDGYEYVFFGLQ